MDPAVLDWDPPKVSRATKIPEEEWNKHRMWICDLHENGSTLEEIMIVMRYHSLQEGTFFEPTRKQYVSRLRKWNLRRYGLHSHTEGGSSALPTRARSSRGSSGESNGLLDSLQYHQSKCYWCELASLNFPAIQHNVQLAARHGPLSMEEIVQKMELADFYLAEKNLDDACALYVEVLYRSSQCSGLDQLHIFVKVLHFSAHFRLQTTAKDHLVCLLLMNADSPKPINEPRWIMHLLRGMTSQTCCDFDLATLHMQRAAEICDGDGKIPCRSGTLNAQRELISGMAKRLKHCEVAVYAFDSQPTTLPTESLRLLIEWCLEQVRGDDYFVMLSSSPEEPWTEAPDFQSFKDFESTILSCYLWQKYRDTKKAKSSGVLPSKGNIFRVVEYFEQSLYIQAPAIFSTVASMRTHAETFSTVASMRTHAETASWATGYVDSSPVRISKKASLDLRGLLDLWFPEYGPPHFDDAGAILFFKTYASLSSHIKATDEQKHFSDLAQDFVRKFAQAQFPPSAFNLPLESPEAYVWTTTSATGISRAADQEGINKYEPVSGQSGFAIPTVPPTSPSVPPKSDTDHDPPERPASTVSVDMLTTDRSSLSSSRASLRSLQRLGQVAELLLKRGSSGASQLPSEAMGRDSHSSWSLRRLTGVSYLSATSKMTLDEQTEPDTIMEEAPPQI